MSMVEESDALHRRVRAMVRAFEHGRPMPEPFDALATDLGRFQARAVPGHARLCAARGLDPERFGSARDVPAVPTDAFKLARVFAFDASHAAVTFRTSGTTIGRRGEHSMRDVTTYDLASVAFGRAMLARDLGSARVLVIGPSPAEAADSSLAHMCGTFARAFGRDEAPARTYFVREGALDVHGLLTTVAGLGPPAIVLATSFALVHLLDAVGSEQLPLPPGSRVMQTGGFKGKSREVSPDELRRAVAALFAVSEGAVVGEYGMTELTSQFWEPTLIDAGARHGIYVEPPWARVVPVDPESLEPVAAGAVGIARIEDLANVDSAFAVVTQDNVRRVDRGFELLGRATSAPPRGCSIALDEMLSSGQGDR